MKIRNVAHRGLKRFIQHNDASGLNPSVVEKVRNIMTFLQEMEDVHELRDLPSWNAHQLTGGAREPEPDRHPQLAGHIQNRPGKRRNLRLGL